MNNGQTTAIALYTTFSDEFVKQRLQNYKYPLKLLLMRDITVALLKHAYKKYYDIDVDPEILNSENYFKQKQYGGLYYAYTSVGNAAMVAIGKDPLAVGKSIRCLTDDWKPSGDLFHINEYKIYEQSEFNDDTLCELWAQKEAYNKMYSIDNPSENKFDNSFQKEHDSAVLKYSLRRFDYNDYAHYFAVTGKAEFEECGIEEILGENNVD